jgi:HPt (histidine-containing phosphotransfer) domain-containing protein
MTAHALSGDRERCINAGMDDYLSKPLQPKVFFSMLERWTSSDEKPAASFDTDQNSTSVNEYDSIQNPIFEDDGLFGEESKPHDSLPQPKPQHTRTDFSNIAPMDMQSALFHFDGDKIFMMELFTIFIAGLPDRLSEIQTALKDNNANVLARLAHNLKGTSLNFGTEPLATLSAELEEMGKHDDIQFSPDLVEQLQEEVHRLQRYIQELT